MIESSVHQHRKQSYWQFGIPRGQTTVIQVLPHTSVQNILERCCRRKTSPGHNVSFHSNQTIRSLECTYVGESIELCIKQVSSIALKETEVTGPFGLSFQTSVLAPPVSKVVIMCQSGFHSLVYSNPSFREEKKPVDFTPSRH